MVNITENARNQLKSIQTQENKEGHVLRVSVVAGGCSGMSYKLDFVPGPTDKDKIFDQDGLKVAVDPKSLLFLRDMTLDYSSGLNGKGFEFHNPNAKKSCGCGTSFSA
jgi:iron-sulfur cluster assembly protein